MNHDTLKALKASIEKWKANASAESIYEVRLGMTDCPLCMKFHSHITGNRGEPKCNGCPVYAKTGISGCANTPYDDADQAFDEWDKADIEDEASARSEFIERANEEVAFLESLLPEDAR